MVDTEKLCKLAAELSNVIEAYGIDFEKFAINIVISQKYFDAIKDEMASMSPHPSSQTFSIYDEDWAINFVRPLNIDRKMDK